ncbi:hypothetical protein HDV04_005715 [Boothiomyces sp. JEL0838]|nr:hypothetical protein HDV04_005715 [Boothiomyces sp. JEL0838]
MYSLFLSALASSVAAYSLCNPTNYPYAGLSVTNIPILSTVTQSLTVGGKSVPVTVSGSISVVDGCNFATKDLAFSGPASIEFVGRLASDTTGDGAVLLSTAQVSASSSPSSQTYTFVSTAGNWVSYNDFDIIELFDPVSKAVIGTATLPAKNKPVTTTTTTTIKPIATTPAYVAPVVVVTSTTAAAPAYSGKTSDASKLMIGGLSALLLCMVTLF